MRSCQRSLWFACFRHTLTEQAVHLQCHGPRLQQRLPHGHNSGTASSPSPAPCCSSSFRSRRGGWKKPRDLGCHCDSIEAQVPSSLNLFGEAIILC